MSRRKPAGGRTSPVGSGAIYPLSLCMIVRDEEHFLRDALTSVEGVVDEICIADTGSTDGTVAIAEAFGAKISRVTWRDDFAWARNQALAMASGAWIFVLDADERLAPESREMLRALRSVKPDDRGRWIRCRNYGDAERKTVASTNAIVRIFPNDPAIRYRGTLHEYIARTSHDGPLPAERTPIEIVHHGYTHDVMSSRLKAERNLRVSQTAFEGAPDDPVFVYNYAMSALLAGENAVALEQLERVIALTAGTPRGFRPMALSKLAGLYVEAGRAGEALTVADECIAIVASYPDGHFARGRALIGLGRYDESRASFDESIRAGSSTAFEHFVVDDEIASWKAHNEIAGTFVIERRYAEARQRLEQALKVRPNERTVLLNLARCCEAQGDLITALATFRAVLDIFHDEPGAIEYVNYVFRHEPADAVLGAVEAALPVLGDDYRRAFLTSAAAAMLRVQRRSDAAALLRRVLAIGDEMAGRAVVQALAQHYKQPELNDVLAGV